MFESLDERIELDEKKEYSAKQRMLHYLAITAISVVVVGGLAIDFSTPSMSGLTGPGADSAGRGYDTASMSFRLQDGARAKLKIEHSILENLRYVVLDQARGSAKRFNSAIPGVIRPVRDAKGTGEDPDHRADAEWLEGNCAGERRTAGVVHQHVDRGRRSGRPHSCGDCGLAEASGGK